MAFKNAPIGAQRETFPNHYWGVNRQPRSLTGIGGIRADIDFRTNTAFQASRVTLAVLMFCANEPDQSAILRLPLLGAECQNT